MTGTSKSLCLYIAYFPCCYLNYQPNQNLNQDIEKNFKTTGEKLYNNKVQICSTITFNVLNMRFPWMELFCIEITSTLEKVSKQYDYIDFSGS